MPRSMTGFGRAEIKNDKYEISAEIRNLNNRYLDIGLKLPKILTPYEFKLKELIKRKVKRGKFGMTVTFKSLAFSNGQLNLSKDSVKFYHDLLLQLKKYTGIKEDISLAHLLQFKELIEPEEQIAEEGEIEKFLMKLTDITLDDLNSMREHEAQNLSKDILHRVDLLKKMVDKVFERGSQNPRQELDRLYERIQELIKNNDIDRDRLEQELALLADRVDITEECKRLESHLLLFRNIFEKHEEVGKRLTFVLQEMQRETNTIGSKTTDVKISHKIIQMKEEIEKLREQVQNLE